MKWPFAIKVRPAAAAYVFAWLSKCSCPVFQVSSKTGHELFIVTRGKCRWKHLQDPSLQFCVCRGRPAPGRHISREWLCPALLPVSQSLRAWVRSPCSAEGRCSSLTSRTCRFSEEREMGKLVLVTFGELTYTLAWNTPFNYQ